MTQVVTQNGSGETQIVLPIEFSRSLGVIHSNREAYLKHAVLCMRDWFRSVGIELPESLRVSVGFPGGGSARKRIGEYWRSEATTDGVAQIFISPTLECPEKVLSTLLHELVHAAHPSAKHSGLFKQTALKLGFTGPMKFTPCSLELRQKLFFLHERLGGYPHGAINLSDRKKQSTRLLKVECGSCGYVARVSGKWIEEVGTPLCPCNSEPMNSQGDAE